MKKRILLILFVAMLLFFSIQVFKIVKQPAAIRVRISDSGTMDFILVRAGEFQMGSPKGEGRDDEHPQHKVIITRPYYLGKYEVTQQQWLSVMDENPSGFASPERPVERITWAETYEFASRLDKLGRGNFEIPTEAEWEYACRAGSHTQFFWGDSSAEIASFCNFADLNAGQSSIFHRFDFHWADLTKDDGFETTAPVGKYRPNPWGFYDILGNVFEWCSDWYAPGLPYSSETRLDPTGPDTGEKHVVRGGSWGDDWTNCRPASRATNWSDRWWVLGVRMKYYPPQGWNWLKLILTGNVSITFTD
ncbi:MAG: SUMF1/EgtB/PvdO family nonheme iron enzyme [Candidatus Wallbacteria bacterium]|nr:SUMF1/EgtB/PvdO family nonheme iron enzyme [Candidatus Wallbacteria bacterium]